MADITKVIDTSTGAYFAVSTTGVLTLSDGTNTVTWTPGGAVQLVLSCLVQSALD